MRCPRRGTEGSNPSPSSGESRANLTSHHRCCAASADGYDTVFAAGGLPDRALAARCGEEGRIQRSSITEHSFHGIHASPGKGKGVTHVSGTICHVCLGPNQTLTLTRGKRFRVGPCLRPGLAVARQASLSRGLAEVSAISAAVVPVGEGQGDGF